MREVLKRRFSRALKEDPDRTGGQWPDLVLIDGGRGQLGVTLEVFEELGIEDVAVAAIAKGPDRDAGREKIYRPNHPPKRLPLRDPVLFFVQRLRDEAHRFAISAHRDKRSKSLVRSTLDDIPSIGAKRKKALLHHFGAAKAVKTFAKEFQRPTFKAGLLDGEILDESQVKALADLPPRDVLLATLLNVINLPATMLARVINEPGTSLARVVKARHEGEE
mgnify:CR=1 FL=1